MFRHASHSIVAILCLAASAADGFGTTGPHQTSRERGYPARISNPHFDGFDWIAATELVDETGLLREELVRERDREALSTAFYEANTAAALGGEPLPCFVKGQGHGHFSPRRPPRNTVDQIIDQTELMFTGTVISREGGFGGVTMSAMTVLEVSVDTWLIVSPRRGVSDTVFVLYPAGNFSLGELEICGHTDGMAPTPEVGDKILLFPSRAYFDYWESEGRGFPLVHASSDGNGIYANDRDDRPVRMAEGLRIPTLESADDFPSVVAQFREKADGRGRLWRR